MFNLVRIGIMASEKISFENVDDGGWMDDGRRMPYYTISSPRELSAHQVSKNV